MGACGAGRAAGAGRGAGAAPAAGRFPPIEESKVNRAVRVSILAVPGSSPLLSERFRRPISPVHTEAFQVGWILQVLSVTTLSFSPSWSMMGESGRPVTE